MASALSTTTGNTPTELEIESKTPSKTITIAPSSSPTIPSVSPAQAKVGSTQTSITSPPATPSNSIPIKCGDRTCTTGQIILPTNNTARKVSSHFFGRNKSSTKAIDSLVWHVLCRMTYQRSRYAAEKLGPKALCQYYIDHLKHQFVRIRLWRPEAKFEVKLWEAAKKRLNEYHAIVRRGVGEEDAKKEVEVIPGVGKKGEKKTLNEAEGVSMEHAEYIDEVLAGKDKSIGYIVDTVIPWIQGEVDADVMRQMPPIEFLINDAVQGEKVMDPKSNFARWEAVMDDREFVEVEEQFQIEKKLPKLLRLVTPPRPSIKLRLFKPKAEEMQGSLPEKPHRPADDLPLWQPPSPSVLAALERQGKGKQRAFPVDTALANELGGEVEAVKGTPRMARGMVFAGGKMKVVSKKRVVDEVYDDETESEGEPEAVSKKVKLT